MGAAQPDAPDCNDSFVHAGQPLFVGPRPTGPIGDASATKAARASFVKTGLGGGLMVLAGISPGVVGMVALNETQECFKCGGTGKCQQDYPAGSGLQMNGAPCSSCSGTGKCPQCGGTGVWEIANFPGMPHSAAA
jgi:hypothetical protein